MALTHYEKIQLRKYMHGVSNTELISYFLETQFLAGTAEDSDVKQTFADKLAIIMAELRERGLFKPPA